METMKHCQVNGTRPEFACKFVCIMEKEDWQGKRQAKGFSSNICMHSRMDAIYRGNVNCQSLWLDR